MNYSELILHCAKVNAGYMRLPAGQLGDFTATVKFYQRLADQSVICAQAWVEDKPCPKHEPAVDAFWWAVWSWAQAFGSMIGLDYPEWREVFIIPHRRFANYLRPLGKIEKPKISSMLASWREQVSPRPAEVIIELDVVWTKRVMKLTARWGLIHHLKDISVLVQTRQLLKELQRIEINFKITETQRAYLISDIEFFYALFEPFPFSPETKKKINDFLVAAESEIGIGRHVVRSA